MPAAIMLVVWPVLGNSQRLDGGAMYGNAPRALWSRWSTPDSEGRIPLACRAVLLDDGRRKVLLETGIGTFFDPKQKGRYGVVEDEHVLLDSLAALGVAEEDIDTVVLSHLHFDHAGGLLSPWEGGKPLRLLFPRAAIVVGEEALARASSPHPRDRASFVPELPELLARSGRLHVVPRGSRRSAVLGERFTLWESHGHTPGMLHVTANGAAHELFFASDLVPGTAWLRPAITMGYDRFPELLVDEKRAKLESLASTEKGAWLAFTHDPVVAFGQLARDGKGGFLLSARHPDGPDGWDLDTATA